MLVAHWFEIPIVASLVIMGAILAVCALASVLFPKKQEAGSKDQGLGTRDY